jgi:hypothetical protein
LLQAEVDHLRADWGKAHQRLGWEPTVSFHELVNIMVDSDLADIERTLAGGPAVARAAALEPGQSSLAALSSFVARGNQYAD